MLVSKHVTIVYLLRPAWQNGSRSFLQRWPERSVLALIQLPAIIIVIFTHGQLRFQLSYPSGAEATLGNELTPTQVKEQPTVSYEADPDVYYTLVFTGKVFFLTIKSSITMSNNIVKKWCQTIIRILKCTTYNLLNINNHLCGLVVLCRC